MKVQQIIEEEASQCQANIMSYTFDMTQYQDEVRALIIEHMENVLFRTIGVIAKKHDE